MERLIKAAGYSVEGLKAAYQHEASIRLEAILLLVLVPAALWLGDNGIERAILITSLLGVFIVELLNSAIETVVDRISIERHELSKRAKDIGSAAVFIAIANVVVVWGLVLLD